MERRKINSHLINNNYSMDLLVVSAVSKKMEDNLVLDRISFTQQAAQKIAIAGETGSGKTTLLKVIAGLEQPTEGKVLFHHRRVKGPEEALIPGHPHIAYLSQHFELRNNYRVEEILSYANVLPEEEAALLLQVCRIEHLLKRKTEQLSGGERQRIALARLLLAAPQLLLLDEPFSNLDPIHKKILKEVIRDIGEKLHTSCLMASHDPLDTLSWADEIIVLKKGKIIQLGSPLHIYKQPVDAYTAGLFGNYNLITPENAAVFKKIMDPGQQNKCMMIRPESFRIVPQEEYPDNGIGGIVKEINFAGNAYELHVLVPGHVLLVRTTVAAFKKGDNIYLAISPGDVCYI